MGVKQLVRIMKGVPYLLLGFAILLCPSLNRAANWLAGKIEEWA